MRELAFEMFHAEHLAALAAAAVIFIAVIGFRKKLRHPAANRRFRYGTAALLISCELSLQLSYVAGGDWNIGSLPLQLCSLTLLLSAIRLITGNERLNGIVFFLGSLGAMQALLTPNLDESFPHFRYFHFFIAHIGIVATSLFLYATERYRPTLRSMFGALLWLHVLAVPAALINTLSGRTNFMFLAGKPSTASILDLLAPWPWYLLELELVALLLCLLMLGAVKITDYIYGRFFR